VGRRATPSVSFYLGTRDAAAAQGSPRIVVAMGGDAPTTCARAMASRLPCSLAGRDRREARFMVKRHLPSVEALSSNDDERWIAELRLEQVREHVVLVRTLLEHVDRLLPLSEDEQPSTSGQVRTKIAEELARLGCKIVEVASVLSDAPDPAVILKPAVPGQS
jgi:hypothetical protein